MGGAMSKLSAYIITVEARADRVSDAESLRGALETSGIFGEVGLHPAIYWRNRRALVEFLGRFPVHSFDESYLDHCLMGQVAATLSHIGAWRRLLASDADAAIVFEDDVYVTDMQKFAELAEHLQAEPSVEWARLHLHKAFRDQTVGQGGGAKLIDDPQPWGFAAYYVTRAGAQKLLDHSRDIATPVDLFPQALAAKGALVIKSATEVLVEHHAFEGDAAELERRAEIEQDPNTVQNTESAIYSSPPVRRDGEMHRFLSLLTNLGELRRDGATVIRGVFNQTSIESARRLALAHRKLFRNTRPTPSAGHLPAFHRFPELERLHTMLTSNEAITQLVGLAVRGEQVRTIGLSDITINRSQQWHVDLLRGKYRQFLDPRQVWGPQGGGVYKAILYLNDTSSLKVIKGSHLRPISLESDLAAEPVPGEEVMPVDVKAGDVVVIDLRCRHRGADEAAYASGQWDENPRILVSTVFGSTRRELTRAMEVGNFFRLMDWLGDMKPPAKRAKGSARRSQSAVAPRTADDQAARLTGVAGD